MAARALEYAFHEAAKLTEGEQESLAEWILEIVEDYREHLDNPNREVLMSPKLIGMISRARRDFAAGRTESMEDFLASISTCRDEVLDCARELVDRRGIETFTIQDIVDCMQENGTRYAENTIRTHVSSVMCANAPKNHTNKTDDLERVAHGLYRLKNRDFTE